MAAHLVWVADLYSDATRRALAGDVGPPPDLAVPESRAVLQARMAEIASAYRRDLGDGVADAFASRAPALVALFEGLAPADWDRPAYHPGGVRPIRRLLAQHIVEVCVHGWDMLHRPGREVALPEGATGRSSRRSPATSEADSRRASPCRSRSATTSGWARPCPAASG